MDESRHDLEFGCRISIDGTIRTRSSRLSEIFGPRSNVFDVIAPADRERLLHALTEGDPVGTAFDLRFIDGHRRTSVFNVVVERDDAPVGATGSDRSLPAPRDSDGLGPVPTSFNSSFFNSSGANEDRPGSSEFELHVRDVTEARRLSAVLHAHREVLDQIATGAPIATGLDAVARMVEAVAPATTVAIYLRNGELLELAAAPTASPMFATKAARITHAPGVPTPGTIEPVVPALGQVIADCRLGFGWWRTVLDELGDEVGMIVLLATEKRFLTADERLQLDEAARLVSVAAGTARSTRRALDSFARDPLTGVLHRRALLDLIAPSRAVGPEQPVMTDLAVVGVAVDALDAVNAEFGYEAGDAMLQTVADRLRQVVRGRDLVARWTGKCFVVLGRNRGSGNGGEAFAQRVHEVASSRLALGGQAIDPELRIVVTSQARHETAVDVLRRVEQMARGHQVDVGDSGTGLARR